MSTGTSGDAVQVASVAPGGPAAAAGVRAGDRLVSVGGEAVDTPEDVTAAIADRVPGDRVELVAGRPGAEQALTVTLGRRPVR